MDWERVGQAFQGGANVLAGGLMDKYQRGKDIEEQTRQQQRRDLQDQVKAEFDNDPELRPIAQKAYAGDPDAQNTLNLFAGLTQALASGKPFTEEHYGVMAKLPPGTKSRLIGKDLKLKLDIEARERQRKLDAAQEETRVAQLEHMRKLEQRWDKEVAPDESNLYDYRVSEKAREAEKKKEILAVVKEINDLNSKILSTRAEAERAGASKTQAGVDPLKEEVEHLMGLRDEAIARRNSLIPGAARDARQKLVAEAEAKAEAEKLAPAGRVSPTNVVENIALTPEDMKEIEAAKKARPDLSEDEIIRAYVAYKRKR